MRALKTIIFLVISNTFMTFAWYGHLKFKEYSWGKDLGLLTIILISWGIAFFEYLFQVPANRAGSLQTGGAVQPCTVKNHPGGHYPRRFHPVYHAAIQNRKAGMEPSGGFWPDCAGGVCYI